MIKKQELNFYSLILWIITPLLTMLSVLLNFDPTDTVFYTLLIVGFLGLIVGFMYFKENKFDKKQIFKDYLPITLLVLFLVWTFICCILADDKYLSIIGSTYRKEGFITYIGYAGIFLLGFLFTDKKKKKSLLYLIIAITTIIGALSLLPPKISVNFFPTAHRYVGTFYNLNHFGYLLTIALILTTCLFCFEEKKRNIFLLIISYIILAVTLILNNTFGCYLAVLITTFFIMIYFLIKVDIRRISIIMLILLILSSTIKNDNGVIVFNNIGEFVTDVIISFDPSAAKNEDVVDAAGTGRMKLWKSTLNLIKEKPIFGYGLENLAEPYAKLNNYSDRPHNIIIQMAAFTGIPGMLLYFGALFVIFIRVLKRIFKASPITFTLFFTLNAYLISALFGNSMYYTSPFYLILLGLFTQCAVKRVND